MPLHSGKSWIRLLLFAAFIMVIGCSPTREDIPFPRCLSADYFGPKPVGVNAYFSQADKDEFIPLDGKYNDDKGTPNWGFHFNQVVKWKKTGFKTNGEDLRVRTSGAWTSWTVDNAREAKSKYVDPQKLEQLKYFGDDDNHLPNFDLVCSEYESTSANNCGNCQRIGENSKPCWFRNGYGAYLLFRKPNDPDPNETLETMRYPKSCTVHMGYNSVAQQGDGIFHLGSNKLKDASCNSVKLESGWEIYVKILDQYYYNNAGGYSFEFLNGVIDQEGRVKILDVIYKFLKDTLLISSNKNCCVKGDKQCANSDNDDNLCAAAQVMFKNIAENNLSFRNFVFALLVLFIVISSLLYLFGMIQQTKHDLLIRMIKVTLVVTLLSPGSFEFFYNNFLILFVNGTEQLIKTVTNFMPNSDNDVLFPFIETILYKFFSYSFWRKLLGLFIYKMWVSILIIPMILMSIILYTILCFYAFVMFLSGFLGLAFLIAMMPLFLICILFAQLKNLFDGWVKLCISFCLQSVMVFILVSLFGALIMNTIYKQLGFTTCYNKWLEVKLCAPSWMFGGFCIVDKEYFSWTPGQTFVPYSIPQATSHSPGTVKFTGGAGYIPIPPNYDKSRFRYIDYPFLDPFPESDYYIDDSDIILSDGGCGDYAKSLARLTNSLLHASDKLDMRILIEKINQEINNSEKLRLDLGKDKIKDSIKERITKNNCQLGKIKGDYKENSDYQRIKDIQQGDLISLVEVFMLFMLSLLIYSLLSLAQEIGAALSGGRSFYTISSMYGDGAPLMNLLSGLSNIGGHYIGSVINGVTSVPGRLFDGTTNLLGRVPVIGKGLKYLPRTLVYGAIETTKFITSPKNDVAKLEEKIYRAFGEDVDDIGHRKINKYLNYYKGYVGSHLGYTLNDAMKFYWSYGLHSIGRKSDQKTNPGEFDHKNDLLYMAKLYRKDFLQKLYDETIGRKIKPEKGHPSEGKNSEEIEKDDQTSRRKGFIDEDAIKQKRIESEERKREVDSDDFGVYDLSSIFDENSALNQTERKNSKEEVEVISSKVEPEKDKPNQDQQSEEVKAFKDSSDHHGRKGLTDDDVMNEDNYLSSFFDGYQKRTEREERKREVDSDDFGVYDLSSIFNENSELNQTERKNSKEEDALKENNISFDYSTEEKRNEKVGFEQISSKKSESIQLINKRRHSIDNSELAGLKKQTSENVPKTFKQKSINEKAGIDGDSKKSRPIKLTNPRRNSVDNHSYDFREFEKFQSKIRQDLIKKIEEGASKNPEREDFIDKNEKTNETTKNDKKPETHSEKEDK
ncbi:MAG: type IV secretion system protein [Wolbachia endosymbiont of Fragariocoptes setiger]|nr:type IV secretion system protein [Wolbachia endosymbiont of Fragariocoptes setiger]